MPPFEHSQRPEGVPAAGSAQPFQLSQALHHADGGVDRGVRRAPRQPAVPPTVGHLPVEQVLGNGIADDELRTGPGRPSYACKIRTLHAQFSKKVIENVIAGQIWRQTRFRGCGQRVHTRVLLWARGILENSPSCSVRICQAESTSSHLGTGFASMQLAYSFLADAAEVNPPSGRYFVFNGGVETITCVGLPSVIPNLAYIGKIRIQPDERDAVHHSQLR